MPTYEFTCPQGHNFEKFYRSIGSAPGEVVCPVCASVAERRLSAGAGLVFKGSGFYITDYGKDGKKDQQAARASSGELKSGESKSSESKSSDPKSGEAGPASSSSSDSKGGSESKASNDGAAPKAPKAAEAAPAPKPTPAAKTAE